MGKKDSNNGGNDPRFSSMLSAPMFKKTRHDHNKVKLDGRFEAVLKDKRFTSSGGEVDKRGRKVHKDKSNVSELSEFYTIDQDDEKDNEESTETKTEPAKGAESRYDHLNKLSRGEISGGSESDDSSDEDDESVDSSASDSDEDNVKTKKGALDIPEDGEITMDDNINTNRLAIQNCDWENLNSQDLM